MQRKVIAEGAETDAQREFLLAHHCDEIQGYNVHRPASAEDTERLLCEMTTVDAAEKFRG
jgi:EAL domain-containing protein (putative c-di-GMP-specific phosphodiesterase class I)